VDTVRFEVRDTGPGIPSPMRGLLFRAFERLGAEKSGVEGVGIGLALCKGFLEAMGGAIGLENPDSGGCVFWAQLPVAASPLDQPQLRISRIPSILPQTGKTDTNAKLLYIESHDFDLQLLERLIEKHPNYSFISAMQGRMGLELATEHRPDLILVDPELPDLKAEEFLLRLRSQKMFVKTPLILLSANSGSSSVEMLAEEHGASFLPKPYKPEEILQLIESRLQFPSCGE
jgi:CheY-like chemotaxis protein